MSLLRRMNGTIFLYSKTSISGPSVARTTEFGGVPFLEVSSIMGSSIRGSGTVRSVSGHLLLVSWIQTLSGKGGSLVNCPRTICSWHSQKAQVLSSNLDSHLTALLSPTDFLGMSRINCSRAVYQTLSFP